MSLSGGFCKREQRQKVSAGTTASCGASLLGVDPTISPSNGSKSTGMVVAEFGDEEQARR